MSQSGHLIENLWALVQAWARLCLAQRDMGNVGGCQGLQQFIFSEILKMQSSLEAQLSQVLSLSCKLKGSSELNALLMSSGKQSVVQWL